MGLYKKFVNQTTERGSHETLMAQNGTYAHMVSLQEA